MKYSKFLLTLLILPLLSCSQKVSSSEKNANHQVSVAGTLYFTENYCGGARPTPEMLAKHSTPKVLPNTTLKLSLVGDSSSRHYNLISDKEGKFSIKLSPGTYTIYMTDKYEKKLLVEYDPACKKWAELSIGQLVVKEESNQNANMELHVHFQCNPCQPRKM